MSESLGSDLVRYNQLKREGVLVAGFKRSKMEIIVCSIVALACSLVSAKFRVFKWVALAPQSVAMVFLVKGVYDAKRELDGARIQAKREVKESLRQASADAATVDPEPFVEEVKDELQEKVDRKLLAPVSVGTVGLFRREERAYHVGQIQAWQKGVLVPDLPLSERLIDLGLIPEIDETVRLSRASCVVFFRELGWHIPNEGEDIRADVVAAAYDLLRQQWTWSVDSRYYPSLSIRLEQEELLDRELPGVDGELKRQVIELLKGGTPTLLADTLEGALKFEQHMRNECQNPLSMLDDYLASRLASGAQAD